MKQRNPQLVGDVIRQAIKDGKLLKALSYERISKTKE